MHILKLWVFGVCLAAPGLLDGQQVQLTRGDWHASEAVVNVTKLQTTITVDREVYAPGEMMSFTITIRNPTNQALEVPEPFRVGCLDLLENHPDLGDYIFLSPEPCSGLFTNDDRKILLQAFETRTRTVRGDRSELLTQGFDRMGGPVRPGQYRVVYSYDQRAHADFTVAAPILEQYASIAFPFGESKDEHGKTQPVLHRVNALAMVMGQQHIVLRTLLPKAAQSHLQTPVGGEWTIRDAMELSPYERVGESNVPITALELAPSNNAGKVLLRWSDASGRIGQTEHDIEFSPSKPPAADK